MVYLFAFPLSLIFEEVSKSEGLIVLKSIGIMLCLMDIMELLQSSPQNHYQNYSSSEDIKKVKEKKKKAFIIQITIIFFTILSIILTEVDVFCNSLCFIFMLINIKKYQKEALGKLESQFFTATHYEKYWDIIKMMAMNLLVCHLLACVLISITHFKLPENWMTKANIFYAPWYEKYVWSYYFGITIILTIGFGDIHAANYI